MGLNDVRKGSSTSPMKTSVKCILWYVGTLALSPLFFLATGAWEKVIGCIVGFPAIWLLYPAILLKILVGSQPVPLPATELRSHSTPIIEIVLWTAIFVIGYCVQIGLGAGAIYAREHRARHRCYLIYVSLLVLDVGIAWFGLILFWLLVGGLGE